MDRIGIQILPILLILSKNSGALLCEISVSHERTKTRKPAFGKQTTDYADVTDFRSYNEPLPMPILQASILLKGLNQNERRFLYGLDQTPDERVVNILPDWPKS